MTPYGRFCLATMLGAAVVAGGGFALIPRRATPLEQAKTLVAAGDLRSALLVLRQAVREHPQSATAHEQLAAVQLKLAQPVPAEQEARTALRLGADRWAVLPLLGEALVGDAKFTEVPVMLPEQGPTPAITARLLLWRGMAQIALKDLPGADATLREALRDAPDQAATAVLASQLAVARKDWTAAERWTDAALALDPLRIEALILKTQLLSMQHDDKATLAAADRAVAVSPWSPRARLDRANLLMAAGQDKRAELDVQSVLANFPRSAEAIYLDGVLLARRGDYGAASTTLDHLGPIVNQYPRALFFQSIVAGKLNQAQTAVDYAQRYVERVPDDMEGVFQLAHADMAAGRPDHAAAVMKKAVDAGRGGAEALDLLGRAYALSGQVDLAVETFKRAEAAAPDDPAVKVHLALTQMRATQTKAVIEALGAGKPDVAEAALDKLRHVVGDTEPVRILEGSIRLARLDLEGAQDVFAATLKAFPESVPAHIALADVLARMGKGGEALTLLGQVLAKDPANVEALSAFVQLALRAHQYDQAIDAVQKANGATPQARGFQALLADVLVQAGQAHRAIDLLLGARDQVGLTEATQGALARAQLAAGMTDDAKQTLRSLLDQSPTDLRARRELVGLQLHENKLAAARDTLREGLSELPGDVDMMAALVRVEVRLDGAAAGLKLADELASVASNQPGAAVLRGEALLQAGQPAAAAAADRAAFAKDPTEAVLARLAGATVAAGEDDQATALLTDWLDKHPGDPAAAGLLAQLDLKAGRFGDARARLELVVARRPNDALALNNLAWLYARAGDKRALTLAQQAFRLAPSPSTADTLGWIMVQGGDAKGAVPLLQKAAAGQPDDPGVAYHLAVALKQTGEVGQAADMLKVLVARKDDFAERKAARALLDGLTPRQ